jgi:DNA-binding winged helix-turn-helix (wHTH) protein
VSRLRAGPWLIDLGADLIDGPGGHARVAPKAMAVLGRLVATPAELGEKTELLRCAWPDSEVGDQVLVTAIYQLRRAFAAVAAAVPPIETVPRRGYLFSAEVEPVASRGAPVAAHGEGAGAEASQLRALQLLTGPRYEQVEEGIRQLEATTRLWPDFAPAHAGLARGYYMLASWGRAPGTDLRADAAAAALRAYELDPNLTAARTWGAMTHLAARWRPAEAAVAIEGAVQLAPDCPWTRDALAHCLAATGQLASACREAQRALTLDPLSPALGTSLGFFLRLNGQLEGAERQLRAVRELSPAWAVADLELGRVLLARGDWCGASEAIGRAEPTWGRFLRCLTPAGSRPAKARGGAAQARKMLDSWLAGARGHYVAPYWLAERCMWAGCHEAAIDQLERARREHQMHLLYAGVEPAFRPLHGHRRFRRLLDKMNLTGTQRPIEARCDS